ncbi:MAG TPA: WYL domain-containing protein [Planctomycetaceae bacterium]|nr:WYL domain-containing protein [Planctomycetaceae bacterium]
MTDTGGLPSLSFTLEEAAALYLGRQFLEGLAGTLFWTGAQSAFKKIQSALGDAALQHLQKLATAFYLQSHAITDYSARADLIDQLMVAIEERRLTVITYHSLKSTEPVSLYDIHPYALIHHKSALYLIAWSKDHGEIRTFKVDRVSNAEHYDLKFTRPENFDPATHLEHSFGIFAGDGPPQKVRVRFAAPVARILEEKRFHPSQAISPPQQGWVTAEFTLSALEEFSSWILSFGPMAEVLEPVSLRDQVADSLRQSLALYLSEESRTATVRSKRGVQ